METVKNKSNKTEYFKHSFNISDGQIKTITESIKNNEPAIIKLSKKTFINGNIDLPLNKTDAKNVIANKGFIYNLNITKLKMLKVVEKDGGFFPLLLPILAAIGATGSVIGGTAGIVKAVSDKKINELKQQEEVRHNKEIETIARGDGIFINPWKNGNSIIVKDFANNSKLDNIGKRTFRSFMKNLNDNIKIEKHGNGIYLSNLY